MAATVINFSCSWLLNVFPVSFLSPRQWFQTLLPYSFSHSALFSCSHSCAGWREMRLVLGQWLWESIIYSFLICNTEVVTSVKLTSRPRKCKNQLRTYLEVLEKSNTILCKCKLLLSLLLISEYLTCKKMWNRDISIALV